ncbi:EG45-like domain containing protein 2 [Malania oleifera]|uniref:EG45-like domain containing protein 2 n=1 Tax=Malania oleifera TaxID=397392 RepID=UPI0025AE852D|nr:EG45-like domain containing protein 2 [Malania oleifera]
MLPRRPLLFLFLLLVVAGLISASIADVYVGTAAKYIPPYLPTRCYGKDATELPTSNYFAAAGEGIWDNGAACGRQYAVKCISARAPAACIGDRAIQIKIVDYAASMAAQPSVAGTTMVLSGPAFAAIANTSVARATYINLEFQQV